MNGIDPETGLTVVGAAQAAQRIRKAVTTEIGTIAHRRKVGGRVRRLFGLASELNRIKLINRIFEIFDNPANDLKDIKPLLVSVEIINAGFKIEIQFEFNNQTYSTTI